MFLRQKIRLLLCKVFLQVFAPFAGLFYSFPEESRKRIVLLRHDVLGDFIVFLYSAYALRNALPAKEYCIAVFVTKTNEDWAKKSGLFDEVYVTEKANVKLPYGKRLKQILLFRLLPADVFINTLHGRNGDPDLLAFASPAKRKYGFSLTGWQSRKAAVTRFYERIYTAVYPLSKETSLIESTCRLMELAVGRPVVPKSLQPSDFSFLKSGRAHSMITELPYCVVAPGSGSMTRNWPIENFVEAIRCIKREFPRLNIVLTGSKEETGLCSEIGKKVPVCNLCGKLALSDLATVLGNAALCVANETGTAHFASVFGVPVVCILSGQHYGLYAPCPYRKNLIAVFRKRDCFSCNGTCPDLVSGSPYPCIEEITVDEVMSRIREMTIPR